MSQYIIQDTTLTDIADAIRAKTGDSNPILVSDLATEISNIASGGSGGISQDIVVTFNAMQSSGNAPKAWAWIPVKVSDLNSNSIFKITLLDKRATLNSIKICQCGNDSTISNEPENVSNTYVEKATITNNVGITNTFSFSDYSSTCDTYYIGIQIQGSSGYNREYGWASFRVEVVY